MTAHFGLDGRRQYLRTYKSTVSGCRNKSIFYDNYPHILRSAPDYHPINEIMKAVGISKWKGTWKEGTGTISTASDTVQGKGLYFLQSI